MFIVETELLRTFLEVRQTRHFAKAATNLFITQAAVSARIRQLENILGQRLFTRGRNNIQLTTAGHQLVPYAETILGAWDRAVLETASRQSGGALVSVGCLPSLREIYLDEWLLTLMTSTPPRWLLQVESLNTAELVLRVREGSLSIGVLYEPPRATDLWLESLTRFDLLPVSTSPGAHLRDGLPGYIYVDWGSSFAVVHDASLTGQALPQLKLDTSMLAREILLAHGGAAYLAEPMIRKELNSKRLFVVEGAPVIQRTVYVIANREIEEASGVRELVYELRARLAEPEC